LNFNNIITPFVEALFNFQTSCCSEHQIGNDIRGPVERHQNRGENQIRMSVVVDQVLHERSPVPAEGNIQTAPDPVHVHKTLVL